MGCRRYEMLELILSATVSVGFTYLGLWLYRRGLKDGLALKDNKPIEPIKTPVEVISEVKTAKVTKEQEARTAQYLENLLSYTGETQKEIETE
jgi:hypothetical protein